MNSLDDKNAITPSTIENKKFRIPLYQRPYAWEEKQVKQLLDDLYMAKENKENYYIGILSVAKTHDDQNRYDLIDGQQRITTLMLIGKAALKHCNENWASFLIQKRLELYGRKADQEFLDSDNLAKDNPRSKGLGEVTPTMIKAFETAKKFFEDCDKDDAKAFAQYIYENAAFFISNVPPKYSVLDKNQHFVRMNNRGRQLEKHEILKVRLVKELSESEENQLLMVWNNILDFLSGIKEDQDDKRTLAKILHDSLKIDPKASDSKENFYSTIITIPEFLLIALARFLKKECINTPNTFSFDKEKLLETFHNNLENKDIVKFTEFIDVQLKMLRSFFICISHHGNKNKIQYKFGREASNGGKGEDAYQDNFVDEEKDKNEKQYPCKDQLKAVQSFLHVSTEPHHWLVPALDWCEEQLGSDVKAKIKAKDFVERLEYIDNQLANVTNDKTRILTSIDNFKDMEYGSISHYWFYRLDYELWKTYQKYRKNHEEYKELWSGINAKDQKVKNLFDSFRFRRCSSVEHIDPQNPIEKEPIVELNSFGNLALISRTQNSKFSNNPPDGKKEIILNSEYTESLKMAHFLWCNRDNIGVAGKRMYDILYNAVKKNPKSGDSDDCA